MQDYERLINHFFYHFNITIIAKLKEQSHRLSPNYYSVSYRVENTANSSNNGLVVRFSFYETDDLLTANISCSYEDSSRSALQFDGAVFKDEIALGLKCMDFLDREQIRHYSPLLETSAVMDKVSRKISFNSFNHTLNVYTSRLKTERLELLSHVNKLLDIQLKNLEIETKNVSLNDKLDLLAMVMI